MTNHLTTHGHQYVALFLALVAAAMVTAQPIADWWHRSNPDLLLAVDERDFEAGIAAFDRAGVRR